MLLCHTVVERLFVVYNPTCSSRCSTVFHQDLCQVLRQLQHSACCCCLHGLQGGVGGPATPHRLWGSP